MYEQSINIDRMDQAIGLFGSLDHNVRLLEKAFSVTISVRNGEMKISGEAEDVSKAVLAVQGLLKLLNSGETLNDQNVEYVISMVNDGQEERLSQLVDRDCICITSKGRPVKPKTIGQQNYVQAIRDNTVVLAVGPAGTGKTYLAVAQAVQAFRAKDVNRIILTRPAVEAGEKLGFLPGDIQQKVDPYLRPLYDALFDMLGAENFMKYQERGNIEVAPLAYMRGRTLDDSFIILDEAQNTTPEQMKMFLTRLGFNSKVVVTGDITQIDLADGKKSGLMEATAVLKNVEDIAIVTLNEKDVVRHKLVQSIIKAYDQYTQKKNREATRRREYDGKSKSSH
ncbi:MAG: PhoH family protein [Clostridia bacterium]|nr:PhoH family protein [Clostridia bacterium]